MTGSTFAGTLSLAHSPLLGSVQLPLVDDDGAARDCGCRRVLAPSARDRDQPRQDHQERKEHLSESRRSAARGGRSLPNPPPSRAGSPENPCTSSRSVSTKPSPITSPKPLHAQRIGARRAPCPRQECVDRRPGSVSLYAVPSAYILQSDPHQRQKSRDDQEELQHLVVNRAGQPAQEDVASTITRRRTMRT